MKRFVVSVICGFTIQDHEPSYNYEHHFFDTYSEARRFAMKYPKGETVLYDLERLPF